MKADYSWQRSAVQYTEALTEMIEEHVGQDPAFQLPLTRTLKLGQNARMRNIEPDFRQAFDDAVQISLSNSGSPGQFEGEQTDEQADVPSLETEGVRSPPPVVAKLHHGLDTIASTVFAAVELCF